MPRETETRDRSGHPDAVARPGRALHRQIARQESDAAPPNPRNASTSQQEGQRRSTRRISPSRTCLPGHEDAPEEACLKVASRGSRSTYALSSGGDQHPTEGVQASQQDSQAVRILDGWGRQLPPSGSQGAPSRLPSAVVCIGAAPPRVISRQLSGYTPSRRNAPHEPGRAGHSEGRRFRFAGFSPGRIGPNS